MLVLHLSQVLSVCILQTLWGLYTFVVKIDTSLQYAALIIKFILTFNLV
jgi:hypothetical protein